MTNPDHEPTVVPTTLTQTGPTLTTGREHELKTKLISIASELLQALPESQGCSHQRSLEEWPGPDPDHHSHRPLPSEKAFRWVGTREEGSELLYARYRQKFLAGLIEARSQVPGCVWESQQDSVAAITLPEMLQSVTGQIAAIVSYMTFCPGLSAEDRKLLSETFKGLDTYTGGSASGVVLRLEPKYPTTVDLTAADKAIVAPISHFAAALTANDHVSAADETTGDEEMA